MGKNIFADNDSVLDSQDPNDPNSVLYKGVVADNDILLDKASLKDAVNSPKQNIEMYVTEAVWVDNPKTLTPINFLPYKTNDNAYLLVRFKNAAVGSKITVRVYDLDLLVDDSITAISSVINQNNVIFTFDLNGKVFYKGVDSILHLYVSIIIDNNAKGDFCKTDKTLLKVHVVRYIPQIMSAIRWNVGASLQKYWFNAPSNSDYKKRLGLDLIRFSYFMQFERFKTFIDSVVSGETWLSNKAKLEFINLINNKINQNAVKLPETILNILNFGNSSKQLVRKGNYTVPIYENEYIQHANYVEDTLTAPIDDMFCCLGDFNIHITIYGSIYYTTSDNYLVSIKKIGLHIQDNFDFTGTGISGFLGFWSPYHNKVNKIDPENNSYYYMSDNDYREYRNSSNLGGDFNLLSDVAFFDATAEYSLHYYYDLQSKKRLLKI